MHSPDCSEDSDANSVMSDAESMLLFASSSSSINVEDCFEDSKVVHVDLNKLARGTKIGILSECIGDKPFHKQLTVTYEVCSLCSIPILYASQCKFCRCAGCKDWKARCECKMKEHNRRLCNKLFDRGFYQYNRRTSGPVSGHCLLCGIALTTITSPFLRCIPCLSKSL